MSSPSKQRYQLIRYPHNAILIQVHWTQQCLRMLTSSPSELSAPADHQGFLVQKNQPCLILDTHPYPPTLWSRFLDGVSVPSGSLAPTGVVSEACAVRPLPRSQSRPAAGLGNKQKTRPASPNKCIPDPKAHILNPYDQIPPSSHTGEKVKIRLTSLQCISILPSSWTRE